MATRLTRTERAEANREAVLDAARRVFLAKGYHGTTVDAVAREAGFTIGAVYSRFAGKADLFLALLAQRVEERIEQYRDFPTSLEPTADAVEAARWWAGNVHTDLEWLLLVIEFRVHAARDPELNRRYAALHERTVDALADLLASLYERVGQEMPMPARELGELVMALGTGTQLERAANSEALGGELIAEMLTELFVQPEAGVREGSAA